MSNAPEPVDAAASGDSISRLKEISDQLVTIDPDLFQRIVDAIPDAFLIADSKSNILLVNQQLEYMFGYPRSMLLGKRVDMLMPDAVRKVHAKHFDDYFMNPSVRPMNKAMHLIGQNRDGRPVTVQISLGPIVGPQGTWALALIRRIVDGK